MSEETPVERAGFVARAIVRHRAGQSTDAIDHVAEEIPVEALRSPDQKASIPPLHGALLKNEQDMHLFERLVFMAQRNR